VVTGSLTSAPSTGQAIEQSWRTATAVGLSFLLTFGIQCLCIRFFAVNAPFLDDWSLLSLFDHFRNGQLSLSELFAQHTDHRLVAPRLIFLAIYALLGEWNLIAEMFVSALLAGLTSAVLAFVVRRDTQTIGVPALIAVVLALPAQWENILWGFQLQFYLLNLLAIALVATCALIRSLSYLSVVAICAIGTLATFTMGSGASLWAVAVASLVAREGIATGRLSESVRNRAVAIKLAVVALAGIVSLSVYLHGYHQTFTELKPRDGWTALRWFARAVTFPLLERPSWWRSLAAAGEWIVIGLGARQTFVDCRRARSPGGFVVLLGLTTVLLFNVAITAWRRSDYINWSGDPELLSRYATVFLLNVVLFVLCAHRLHTVTRFGSGVLHSAVRTLLGLSVVGVWFAHVNWTMTMFERMKNDRRERLEGVANIVGYLRSPRGHGDLSAPFLFPNNQRTLLESWLRNPQFVELLPPNIASRITAFPAEIAASPWTYVSSPESRTDSELPYAWRTQRASAEASGPFVSTPWSISTPWVAIPIGGYPRANGNEIAVESEGPGRTRIVYDGANPGDRWDTWFVDVSHLGSRRARITAQGEGGSNWVGVGPARSATNAVRLGHALFKELDLFQLCLPGLVLACLLLSISSRRVEPMVLVAGCLVLFTTAAGWRILRESAQRVADGNRLDLLVDVRALIPKTFVPSTLVHTMNEGIFMHPDSSLRLDAVTVDEHVCFSAIAAIDASAPWDASADGVDFVITVDSGEKRIASQTVSVSRDRPADLVAELPPGQALTLTLTTRMRANPRYDWAVWKSPRLVSCK
jgi:hypothetical protein